MNKRGKKLFTLCLALSATMAFPLLAAESTPAGTAAIAADEVSASRFKAYYTRLPFDDQGFTGKYADIVVELPQRGQFIFSREFGYQPQWLPHGGKPQSVTRLIPRKGDGPDERPDNHNIASNAAFAACRRQSVPLPGSECSRKSSALSSQSSRFAGVSYQSFQGFRFYPTLLNVRHPT